MKDRRFGPLFITQFLGAFNDNVFKTALMVLIAYGLVDAGAGDPAMFVTMAAGIFILPFILLTPLGGDIADKFDKARVIRAVKLVEIVIVLCAIAALMAGSVLWLMLVLFALGAQSALFSPSKYAILPQHLREEELIGANALINTGTYLAILAGTILGSVLIVNVFGRDITAAILLICALIGYGASRFIPEAVPLAPDIKLNYNTPFEAVRIIGYARRLPGGVFGAMLGYSWFFFIGGLYLSQFPNYTSQILKADNQVLSVFMVVFSVGIALGGLLNHRLLKGQVKTTFVPWAALGMALFSFDLFWASVETFDGPLRSLSQFLSGLSGWRIIVDLLGISLSAGLYAVPLKTLIQTRTPKDHMARTLAGAAIMDALFVLGSSVVAMVVFAIGLQVHYLFLMVAILCIPVALYIKKIKH